MSTLQLYGKFGANVLGGEAGGDAFQMDYLTDSIRCTLHTSTYTPAIDTNEVKADATNELGTANGYTALGIVIGGKTVVYSAGSNQTVFDMDDTTVTWTASGGSLVFNYAVFWDDTIASDPLIGYIDCGAQTITTGNTFTITTGASGLFTATVS